MEKNITILIDEKISVENLEISFTSFTDKRGMINPSTGIDEDSFSLYKLTFLIGDKSINEYFEISAKDYNPIINLEGFQITFLNGSRNKIELNIKDINSDSN